MRIAIGADHAGFEMKEALREWLAHTYDVTDAGAYDASPSDYPDIARAVSEEVVSGRVDRGILLCGSGVGASIAANKITGIRAALAHDAYSAGQCVEHDDANILCLGPRVIGIELAKVLVTTFLNATFSGEPRHVRRIEKIRQLERGR